MPNTPISASPAMCSSGTQNIVTVTQVLCSQGRTRSEKQSVRKPVVSATASSELPNFEEIVEDCPVHSHNLQTEVKENSATPTVLKAATITALQSSPLPGNKRPTQFLYAPRQIASLQSSTFTLKEIYHSHIKTSMLNTSLESSNLTG